MVTPEEKRKHLRHLIYEVVMLYYSNAGIAERTQKPGNERNVYIECFALHARALYEFFVSKKHGGWNVVAQDFVADFQPTDTESVSDIIKKIEDQILHMGWKRSEDNHLKFDANKDGALDRRHANRFCGTIAARRS
jgi:hypothetical protein